MRTILSIQSHVAYGHVGNRAAVFPLERMGCEVVPVGTVQFSNHPGHGQFTGMVLPPAHVAEVLAGVAAVGAFARCDAVLSGYMGDAALGDVLLDAVARVRAARPGALYACDPVMGDVGRGFYVRPGIPEFFRDRAVPMADILIPNQFELEYLAGLPIADLPTALAATRAVRARGPAMVLVTSLVRDDAPAEVIEMLLDTAAGAWLVQTPLLPLDPAPNGAGDCVSALFLAKVLATGDPAESLAHAASAIFGVLAATQAAGERELQLIAAQEELVAPSRRFTPVMVR